MKQSPSPVSIVRPLVLLLLILSAAMGLFLYSRMPLGDGPGKLPGRTTTHSTLRLVSAADRIVSQLESWQLPEAETALDLLEKELPDEPFIRRNRVICFLQQLVLRDQEEAAKLAPPASGVAVPVGETVAGPPAKPLPEMARQLLAATKSLLIQEPQDAATQVLAARGAKMLLQKKLPEGEELPDPFTSLQTAAQLAPQEAAVWFELSQLVEEPEFARRPEVISASATARAKAYDLAPHNLAVLLSYLLGLAKEKTATPESSAKAIATLQQAEKLLSPLRKRVERQTGTDIGPLLEKAIAKQQATPPQNFLREALGLANLVRLQEAQKSDLAQVDQVALEYLRFQLETISPGTTVATSSAAAAVVFTEQKNWFQAIDIREAAFVDFNLDGKLDLAVLHGGKLTLVSRSLTGEGWDAQLVVVVPPGLEHILMGDLDRDEIRFSPGAAGEVVKPAPPLKMAVECEQAFPDFVLYGAGGVCVVRNLPAQAETVGEASQLRRLELVETTSGLGKLREVTAATLVDFDHDSDLDLVCAVRQQGLRLWLSLGNGTFAFDEQSEWSELPDKDIEITSLTAVDFDRDLDLDILTTGPGHGALGILENLRHGQYRFQSWQTSYPDLVGSPTLAVLEMDGNVSWDVAGLKEGKLAVACTNTPQPGKVVPWRVQWVAADQASSHSRFTSGDFNNDSFPDLILSDQRQVQLSLLTTDKVGEPQTLFTLYAEQPNNPPQAPPSETIVGVDSGDLDGDGDLDLLVVTNRQLHWLENTSLSRTANEVGNSHWLSLRLAGRADNKGRANNSGLGTLVEVKTPGRYQAQVVSRQPLHFGLGKNSEADMVRLLFTNGVPQGVKGPAGNRQICERMELKGSCPFVYTQKGGRFEFFTDCLWAAPLGLQTAPGKTVPFRSWEYLKLPGERLEPSNGTYQLRLTEELWEAAYFDQVELIAIDHPADVQIYSNEKVGPPEISAYKIHAVKEPLRPIRAVDKLGHDVLPLVNAQDGQYMRGFLENICQGKVDEHWLELDLGDFPAETKSATESAATPLTLFLTGWIYPTDTSLNMALSQQGEAALPSPPMLQVADGSGGWKTVQAFMGFPGGKTKTIAVQFSTADFPPENKSHRLRIITSAEIYWDDAFFTLGETATELREQTLKLIAAKVHYRGFSAPLPTAANSPQAYDYARVSTGPKWPPLAGHFTRYGNVLPLLTAADDQLVVIGSGDEIGLEFSLPTDPLPVGWTRDFILHSIGWDKDADLNTLDGQSSEPLPHHAMLRYPYGADNQPPTTEAYQQYLQTYQTRLQQPALFWRELLQRP